LGCGIPIVANAPDQPREPKKSTTASAP
jgi:hypothetical protein